jgi:cytochrome c peroxidase
MSTHARLPLVALASGALLVAACNATGEGDAPPSSDGTCYEGVSAANCAKVADLMLPLALPEPKGNAQADEFDAALMGFHVFFDARFSSNLAVRCESCHSVDHGFADAEPVPVKGVGSGVRNAPTIFNAAHHTTFLWDGRADTLWSQPLLALENPDEMNFTRLEAVHALQTLYAPEYLGPFGAIPDFSDTARFPPRGRPGDPAFDAMPAADQQLVNSVFANLGKALEAYMRHLAAGPSRLDRYLAGRPGATDPGYPSPRGYAAYPAEDGGTPVYFTPTQERGLYVFARSGCLDCHDGSHLSDDQFHNLGVPSAPGKPLDEGRSASAIALLETSPFNSYGEFFQGAGGKLPIAPAVVGGFRTPSLRNLSRSAPYGHNGVFATLEDVVDFHLQGGGKDPSTFAGTVDPLLVPRDLSAEDRGALIEFLQSLDGDYPELPWGQWPGGNG